MEKRNKFERVFDESMSLQKQYTLITDKNIKENINGIMQQAFVVVGIEDSDEIKQENARLRLTAVEHLIKAALELEKIK